jgi:hypothetical protein
MPKNALDVTDLLNVITPLKVKCGWCKFEYGIGETCPVELTYQDGSKEEIRLCRACYKHLKGDGSI